MTVTGYLQKMPRVKYVARAYIEDVIIAGAFPLETHSTFGKPHQRIEPIHTPGKLDKNLRQAVTTLYVGEFMDKDGAASCVTPRVCLQWNQDYRVQPPPSHRRIAAANAQLHRLRHIYLLSQPVHERSPFPGVRRGRR